MNQDKLWVTGILLSGALFVATSSFAQSDVIDKRQKLMKQTSAAAKAIKAATEASDYATVELKAKDIATGAEQIPALFPKGSTTGKTKATGAIWDKNDDFNAAAKKLGTAATELAAAAKSGDGDAVTAKSKALSGTCGSCHKPFRADKYSE